MYDSYSPGYTTTTTSADPATVFAIFAVLGVVAVIAYVIHSIFLAMIFKKAGIEGWKAWVPVYNYWVFLELGGQQGWIALLLLAGLIPFIGWIGSIVASVFIAIAAYKIGLSFGKQGAFVLLWIFLPFVWLIWLAVDSTAVWHGKGTSQQAVPAGPPPISAPVAGQPQQPPATDQNQQPPASPTV